MLLVSYNEELAANMGRRARDTITVHARELGICISRDTFSATDWKLRGEEGRMLSTGVGGSLTGHGGNLIVIDDLIKNDEEARSKTARDHLWEFFRRTLYTRLEPGGGLIVVGTRWHYDDYIGRLKALLAQTPTNAAGADLFDDSLKLQGANVKRKQRAQIASDAKPCEVITLPALAEANDPLGRQEGAPLWAERFPLEELEHRRHTIGTVAFTSEYQQRPTPEEGLLLQRDWWQRYATPPAKPSFVVQTWDTAAKKGQQHDYSCCLTIEEHPNGDYVTRRLKRRLEFPDLKRAVVSEYEHAGAERNYPDLILIEDSSSGQSVIQELRSISHLPIKPVTADSDKVARVKSISGQVEGGRVLLPAEAPWVEDFIAECAEFPAGRHDDQVDALTLGINYLKSRRRVVITATPGFSGKREVVVDA